MTNQEIADKVKVLSDKIESLKKEQTTLEVKLDQIKEKKTELAKEIKEAFGTDDPKELQIKRDEFLAELQALDIENF